MLGTALVIWASHVYLTRAFSEDQNADSTVRATLYAGSIQSAMQRHSVVPLLLARDPILILALKTGEYDGAEERLADLRRGDRRRLDLPARRRGPRSSPRATSARASSTSGDKAYFARAEDDADDGLLDHRERRRRATASTTPAG